MFFSILCRGNRLGIDNVPWMLHGHTFKPVFHASVSILGVMQLALPNSFCSCCSQFRCQLCCMLFSGETRMCTDGGQRTESPQTCFSDSTSLLDLALRISLRGYLPLSMEDSKAAASLKIPAQPEREILKCTCLNFTALIGCSVMADLGVSALPAVVYNLGEGLWKSYQFQEFPVPCNFYLSLYLVSLLQSDVSLSPACFQTPNSGFLINWFQGLI